MEINQFDSSDIEDQICIDLLSDPKRIEHCIGEIKSYYFANGTYKAIFEAITECYREHKTADPTLVKQVLVNKKLFKALFGSHIKYSEWFSNSAKWESKHNYKKHINELKFAYKVRRLQYFGVNILNWYQQDRKDAKEQYTRFMDEMKAVTGSIDDIRDISMTDAFDMAIEESRKEPNFFKTPYARLNAEIGGGISNFTIYAARTGVGKTTFATAVMAKGMQEGKMILFFNTEMTEATLSLRAYSPVHEKPLYENRFDTEMLEDVKKAEWMADTRSRIISKYRLSVSDIKAKIEEISQEYKIDLVIVDYLQKIFPDSNRYMSAYERVSSVSNDLKDIQKHYDIPFLVLAQLRRLDNKEPSIEDLKGSGDIEQDADNILLAKKIDFTYQDYPVIQVEPHKLRHKGCDIKTPLQLKHIGNEYRYEEVPESEVFSIES